MTELLRNHFLRVMEKKARLLLVFALIIVALMMALFLSNREPNKLQLAVIGEAPVQWNSKQVRVTRVTEPPAKSALVLNTYDAVLDFSGEKPQVTCLKSEAVQGQIAALLSGKLEQTALTQEQTVTKAQLIFGYVSLFLLMAGVTNMFLFSEDKEQHLMERMVSSRLHQEKLMMSYFVFVAGLLFVPTLAVFAFFIKILGIDLGATLNQYALLLLLLCVMSVSFALCNASFFKEGDQASMIGSMLLLLTSLISGNFFTIANDAQWWQGLTKWLPQKQFLQVVATVSQGQNNTETWLKIAYLLGISGAFLLVAMVKNRKTYLN